MHPVHRRHQRYVTLRTLLVCFCGSCDSLTLTHPSSALENVQDFLLCDWLVGGLRVGLGCWREDRVDISIDKRNQLGVDGGGCLTELPVDPVLRDKNISRGQKSFLSRRHTQQLVIRLSE